MMQVIFSGSTAINSRWREVDDALLKLLYENRLRATISIKKKKEHC